MTTKSAGPPDATKTWIWIGSVAGALALGGGAWAVWGRSAKAKDATLPAEYSVDALKADSEEPGKIFEKLRDAADREDLTDEQRRQIGRNMRETMQAIMNQRMDEYFNAPEEEKVAILDRHIDSWQAQMDRWQREREEAEKRGENPDERFRERFGGGQQQPTQEERKARSESRNPDQMARAMSYFMAAQKRMTERGMKMPAWGGRGPGGGGRGPGRGP